MRFLSITALSLGLLWLVAPEAKSREPEQVKFRNDYYDTRRAAHDREGIAEGSVVFIGNSITEQGWWDTLFPGRPIANRGIGGDNTYGMLDRLPDIVMARPSKIFIMAGINDLTAGREPSLIADNIRLMVDMIRESAPDCEIYLQSVLPVNDNVLAYPAIKGKNPQVEELNFMLEEIASQEDAVYLDVAVRLRDTSGQLRQELTKDGIHLHPQAYYLWAELLKEKGYL